MKTIKVVAGFLILVAVSLPNQQLLKQLLLILMSTLKARRQALCAFRRMALDYSPSIRLTRAFRYSTSRSHPALR